MAIPEPFRSNFETLLRAASDGNLAVVECTDASTGAPRYVICAIVAVSGAGEDLSYVMTPFGHLHEDDPYLAYIPSGQPRY